MGKHFEWDAESEARLVKLRTDGLGYREIAKRFGLSSGAVFDKLDRMGLVARKAASQPAAAKPLPRAGKQTLPPLASLADAD